MHMFVSLSQLPAKLQGRWIVIKKLLQSLL